MFISADIDWMKRLADEKLVVPESVVHLLGNRIVLIAPEGSQATITIEKNFALAGLLGDGKLAMADVLAVPAGKYGKAALEYLGVWGAVAGKVAQAENVRAALKLVATGEAALGIVYATDAAVEPGVTVIGTFPPESHPLIIYPAALVAPSANSAAAGFLAYLQSARAQAIFKGMGFTLQPAGN
jgi:molybdate transport system substrate-binding protein